MAKSKWVRTPKRLLARWAALAFLGIVSVKGYLSLEMHTLESRGDDGEVTHNSMMTSIFESAENRGGMAAHAVTRKRSPSTGYCNFGQVPTFQGKWEPHPDADYMGLYSQKNDCPEFAQDFDCLYPYMTDEPTEDWETARAEYNQIFRPTGCELHPWSPEGFMRCFAGRRIILIGDSLMRQSFHSLACLLGSVTSHGLSGLWDASTSNILGNYTARGAPMPILKQFVGNFYLQNGASVHIRSFGQFNVSLWDAVMREFGLLTERDVVIVNFGAWYPRFKLSSFECYDSWHYFKVDMHELIIQRLSKVRAAVYWKDYSPSHFGGRTGTFTGIDEIFPDELPPRPECSPASHGEFWYGNYVKELLHDCGMQCAHIRVLPIFDMSLSRHNAHHGTFGRGLSEGIRDCRHFCQPVVDMWNVVFYNMECFNNPGPPKKKKKKSRVKQAVQYVQKAVEVLNKASRNS